MSRILPAPNQEENRRRFRERNSDRVLVYAIALPALIAWAILIAVTS